MKKYFICSDIHGYFHEWMNALQQAGYDINDEDHILVVLGDLLDRGNYTINCLKFINSIPDSKKILIRGNHEDLLDECLERKSFTSYDYSNGTANTVCDLGYYGIGIDNLEKAFDTAKNNPEWLKYRKSLVDYYETDNYIFVHGWIPCISSDKNMYHSKNINFTFDENWRTGDWNKARWMNGMDAWNQGIRVEGKTIFMGHWHSSYGNSKFHHDGMEFPNLRSTNPDHRRANFGPFIDEGICAVDACCAYSKKINCVVVEE